MQGRNNFVKKLGSLKKHEEKFKTRMGNSTGNADKKSTKMIKQKKDAGVCGNKKGKGTQEKITVQLEEINQKALPNEGRLKRYRQRVKQYRQNRTFQNKEKKINNRREMTRKHTNNQMPKKPNDLY